MSSIYQTPLYQRIHEQLGSVAMVDCHEHLERESQWPSGDGIRIGRLFMQYANGDLVSAGMSQQDMTDATTYGSKLDSRQQWELIEPWYRKAWNTAFCQAIRESIRGLWGFEDITGENLDAIVDGMRKALVPGFTRRLFDKANIKVAMQNPTDGRLIYDGKYPSDCFVIDMVDSFSVPTPLSIAEFSREANLDILDLDDYLRAVDWYFERHARSASAYKISRAYGRTLSFQDVPKAAVESIFQRARDIRDRPDMSESLRLEDFLIHYVVRKCGEHGLPVKFHTGIHAGNGNEITNSRAALMANLFLKYPNTRFDMYHISYPYQEELLTIAKTFPNVTIDFAWMWAVNPAGARRALSDMLDAVPANKIHGFGGDYRAVELVLGHAIIARREIARVLAQKVEEGSFSEDYAMQVGGMLLHDNAWENFDLASKWGSAKA